MEVERNSTENTEATSSRKNTDDPVGTVHGGEEVGTPGFQGRVPSRLSPGHVRQACAASGKSAAARIKPALIAVIGFGDWVLIVFMPGPDERYRNGKSVPHAWAGEIRQCIGLE